MDLSYRSFGNNASRYVERAVVYLVDSDASVRCELERLCRTAGWEVQALGSAEEFLARQHAATPSCLVLEAQLPGMSGLDLQQRVAPRRELPLIFMSAQADVRTTVRAMKAGALEFLTKPIVAATFVSAVGNALECSRAAHRHIGRMRALQQRFESLSRREREVMSLVVSGRLNKQVGGELGISEITVKAHRGKLMRKMQARSFAELVCMVATLQTDGLPTGGTYMPDSNPASPERFVRPHMRPAGASIGFVPSAGTGTAMAVNL